MSRDINATAALLGIGPHKLRAHLKEWGALTKDGELSSTERARHRFTVDSRQRWSAQVGRYVYYAVVMVTDEGVAWLASKLGKAVIITAPAPTPIRKEARL